MEYRTSVGLDVHARSVRAAAFVPETGEVIERGFKYEPAEIAAWARTLPQPACAVYESGPTGFDLARTLRTFDVECKVGAVSKMLKPAGDRIKIDKRDAVFLARMLAVGNVVECRIPPAEEEAVRDLARAREDARGDLVSAKLTLSMFLLRKGLAYSDGKQWTKRHRLWLRNLEFPTDEEAFVFGEYLAQVNETEQRKKRITERLEEIAGRPEYAERVRALRCIKGIGTVTALTMIVEIGDFARFRSAPAFSSFLGLVPSEDSSGESVRRGAMTKTGNVFVRKLLIEAAWHHSTPYKPTSVTAVAAATGAPASAVAKADKANRRLHDRYERLRRRGKKSCVVMAAIARELACWVWAVETDRA